MTKGSGRRGAAALAAAGIAGVIACAAWYGRTKADPPRPAPRRSAEPIAESAPAPIPVAPPPRSPVPAPRVTSAPVPEPIEEPPSPPSPRARSRSIAHDVDPCQPVVEAQIPAGYDGLSVQGITLAWPLDGAPFVEPTAFAYLVAGLLEEAAQLTATVRRERLTVIFYPSREELHTQGGAPKWASGFYDGAVKLPAEPARDFGVQMSSLRHELMHAQLHTGAGCTPLWLNEGTAMYFSGRPPRRAWVRMLRQRKLLDFASMSVSIVDDTGSEDVDLIYGQSLAMVTFLIDRGSDTALKEAIAGLRGASRAEARRAAQELWRHLYPSADPRALLDALARRVFHLPLGPALDELSRGAVCCHGTSKISEMSCRGAPPDPKHDMWIDESQTPIATCYRD